MIRGAIFDLDGTLLDSMPLWETLGRRYLRSLGREPGPELEDILRPMSLFQAADYFRAEYAVARPSERIVSDLQGLVEAGYRDTLPLKVGAKEFLCRLREAGIGMCVATATPSALAQAALTRCGAREFFRGIVSCAPAGRGKESPAVYREALALLGTRPEETAVFEDALYALLTAKNDGFFPVAVRDASEPRQEELRAAARCYLTGFDNPSPFWAAARR